MRPGVEHAIVSVMRIILDKMVLDRARGAFRQADAKDDAHAGSPELCWLQRSCQHGLARPTRGTRRRQREVRAMAGGQAAQRRASLHRAGR